MTVLGRALHADPAIGPAIDAREKQALVDVAAELRRDPKASSPDFAEAIAEVEAEAQKPRTPKAEADPKGDAAAEATPAEAKP